jgi:hypothetical protein
MHELHVGVSGGSHEGRRRREHEPWAHEGR